MSDADKNGPPTEDDSETGQKSPQSPEKDTDSSESASKSPPQKTTLKGPGFQLPSPTSSPKTADNRREKRDSLSARLRKIASKTAQSDTNDEPTVDENTTVEKEEPEEPEEEQGLQTDRLTELPFDIAVSHPENDSPDDSQGQQKSTLLMHSPVDDEPTASSDDDFGESTKLIDIGDLSDDEKSDTQASIHKSPAVNDDEPPTAELTVDAVRDADFEDVPTQISPGLVEETDAGSPPPPMNHHDPDPAYDHDIDDHFGSPFDGDASPLSSGLAEDTDTAEPPLATKTPPETEKSSSLDSNTEPGVFDTANDTPPPVDPSSVSNEIPAPFQDQPPASELDVSDDDFDAPDTELFQSPFETDPICPRLTTLEGPATGQEFLINRMRNSVGRGTNNTVIVPDLSMSRKHFEIVKKSDESYAVQDLMAVNGTTINGVKIKESDLFHGDRLEAGHSVFQFLIPGEAPVSNRQRHLVPAANTTTLSRSSKDKLSAPTRNRDAPGKPGIDRLLLMITIAAGILCIPLIAFLVLTTVSESDDPPVTISAPELYFDGVEALQNQQWDRAERLFQKSHEADPNFGETEAQINRVEKERRALELIARSRDRVGEDFDDSLLAELRSISRESNYYDDAQSLLSLARHDEAQRLFDRAQDAFEDDELDQSLEILFELLAIAPHHEAAGRLEEAIHAQKLDAAKKKEEEAQQELAQAQRAPRQPRPAPSQEPDDDDSLSDPFLEPLPPESQSRANREEISQGSRAINFTEGFTLYRSGRFDDAISHFDAIVYAASGSIADRAQRTANDIRSFRDSTHSGDEALAANEFTDAIDHFEAARQSDEAVAGDGGYFADDVANKIAAAFAGEGLTFIESQNYSTAHDRLQRAQAHAPSESTTRTLSRRLEEQANEIYIRAANQRKSDPAGAASLCRTILTMVPQSSDTHQRARTMLDELE